MREATAGSEEISISYDELLEVLIDFSIIALTIFMAIKFINKLRVKAEDAKNEAEVAPKNIELLACLEELMEEQNEILRNNQKNNPILPYLAGILPQRVLFFAFSYSGIPQAGRKQLRNTNILWELPRFPG